MTHRRRPDDPGATARRERFDGHELFVGGEGQDRFVGTGRMDAAFGRGGPDRLAGAAMDDDLQGGPGLDRLNGGAGMDHLDGGGKRDFLVGGVEDDALRGGDGADYLDEGGGHGDLEGERGDDRFVGGRGGDAFVVDRDSGHDTVADFQAGPGMFDHLALRGISPGELRFEDTARGARVSWADGEGSALLLGVERGELAQDDLFFTEDKRLLPVGGASGDAAAGNPGLLGEGELSKGAARALASASDGALRFDEFRVARGDGGADSLQGTGARDYLFGLGGDDHLIGGTGDDDLFGDAGGDTLRGDGGMDHLKGGRGNDRLDGGAMADNLMGEEGRDTLRAGAGHDMVDGGGGDDRLDGGGGGDAFVVSWASGDDVVAGGFTAGPGAFDHIAFKGLGPDDVTVANRGDDVLASWGTGSIRIEGVRLGDLAQDDLMFDADTGTEGAFEDNPAITARGSRLLFPGDGGQDATVDAAVSDWPLA